MKITITTASTGAELRVDLSTKAVNNTDGSFTDKLRSFRAYPALPPHKKIPNWPKTGTHYIKLAKRTIALTEAEANKFNVAYDSYLDVAAVLKADALDVLMPGLSQLKKAREELGEYLRAFRAAMADARHANQERADDA